VVTSYTSAEASVLLVPEPPATRTLVLDIDVAVWLKRAVVIDPVFAKVPASAAVTTHGTTAMERNNPDTNALRTVQTHTYLICIIVYLL